jgi:hypothetical protein
VTVLFVLGLWIAPQLATQAPHHDLTGTVTNAITGEPINHALVQCPSPRSGSTLTGPDGRFEFSDIPEDDGYYSVGGLYPARYTVFVGGHVIPDSNWDGHLHVFAPAYYPGGPEISSAQLLDLQAGQEYRADFHLRSQPASRVSGTFAGVPAGVGISYRFANAVGQNTPWPVEIDSKHGKSASKCSACGYMEPDVDSE